MGTTLFAAFRLFDPLQQVAGSLGRLFRRPTGTLEPRAQPAAGAQPRPAPAAAACAASRVRPPRRLRVVRVVEGSPGGRASAGRMVISGRMADVCAELDRLAALEAAAG